MQAGLELAGRYTLQELLGSGGMGEVWRGVDQQLDRLVAIKVLRERHADPELARRFQREARIAARLQHPGITVVHDVGSHDSQLFIIMELLHGRDLATILAGAPTGLPVDSAVSLAIQAAEALAAAHAGHVVHRDLKPANLFLLDSGQLKICDFGIAHPAGTTSQLTITGQAIGTPAYMSPEQCEGRHIDGRSDLYSLGCVLHGLLTGRPPFPSGQPLTVMRQHLDTKPPSLRSLRPGVPVQLDRLVLSLLAKDPADRPSNASHVAAMLTAVRYPPAGTVNQGAIASQPALTRTPTEIARTVAAAFCKPGTHDGAAKPSAAAGIDFARAERLINDAEQPARAIQDDGQRANVLARIARAYATIDPARAEKIARAIEDDVQQAFALAGIAKAYAGTDPARAERLINDAEQLVRAIPPGEFNRVFQLQMIADVYVGIHPARAERLINDIEQMARAISRQEYRDSALRRVVETYSAIDPVSAEQIARAIQDEAERAWTLGVVAAAYAATDPARAERLIDDAVLLARRIDDEGNRTNALVDVSRAYAGADPVRAEGIARAIPYEPYRAAALIRIAGACARMEPASAKRLITDAEELARRIHSGKDQSRFLAWIAKTCVSIDRARAERLVNDAEQLARAIPDESNRNGVLADIAEACTGIDADRAEQIAHAIPENNRRARALVRIANAVLQTTDLQDSM